MGTTQQHSSKRSATNTSMTSSTTEAPIVISQQLKLIAKSSLGLALLLATNEIQRFPSVRLMGDSSQVIVPAISLTIALILLLFLLYRRDTNFRISSSRVLVIASAILLAVVIAIFLLADKQGYLADRIILSVALIGLMRCLVVLLSFSWAEVLLPYGARNALLTFAIGLALFALFKIGISLCPQLLAISLLVLAPVASSAFLLGSQAQTMTDAQFGMIKQENASMLNVGKMAKMAVYYLPICLFCYTFSFGVLQYSWFPFQFNDASFANKMEFAYALGFFLASIVMLILVRFFSEKSYIDIYKAVILPVALLTLYLSTVFTGLQSAIYVVPLSFAQKLTFFFFLGPFFYKDERNQMIPVCIAFIAYRLGMIAASLSRASLQHVPDFLYNGIVVILLIILAIWSIALFTERRDGMRVGTDGVVITDNPLFPDATHNMQGANNASNRACDLISSAYHLTKREKDILPYLAKGRTASYIADTMVLSLGTVKGHMHNIYTKMGVHSQQELMDIFEEQEKNGR